MRLNFSLLVTVTAVKAIFFNLGNLGLSGNSGCQCGSLPCESPPPQMHCRFICPPTNCQQNPQGPYTAVHSQGYQAYANPAPPPPPPQYAPAQQFEQPRQPPNFLIPADQNSFGTQLSQAFNSYLQSPARFDTQNQQSSYYNQQTEIIPNGRYARPESAQTQQLSLQPPSSFNRPPPPPPVNSYVNPVEKIQQTTGSEQQQVPYERKTQINVRPSLEELFEEEGLDNEAATKIATPSVVTTEITMRPYNSDRDQLPKVELDYFDEITTALTSTTSTTLPTTTLAQTPPPEQFSINYKAAESYGGRETTFSPYGEHEKTDYKLLTRNEGSTRDDTNLRAGYNVNENKSEPSIPASAPSEEPNPYESPSVQHQPTNADVAPDEVKVDKTEQFSQAGSVPEERADTGESYTKFHRATENGTTGKSKQELMPKSISITKESKISLEQMNRETKPDTKKPRNPSTNKCNNAQLRNIMNEKMTNSAPVSKQLIYTTASEAFPGLSLDVICSRHSFSYIVVTSPIYCEHRKTPLTCFAFFQP